MRNLLHILLLLAFGTQIALPVIVTGNFLVRQKAIAAKFCVNKDRPELNCNGKCFLAKKIEQFKARETEAEQEALMPILDQTFLTLFFENESRDFLPDHLQDHPGQPATELIAWYLILPIDHPPELN